MSGIFNQTGHTDNQEDTREAVVSGSPVECCDKGFADETQVLTNSLKSRICEPLQEEITNGIKAVQELSQGSTLDLLEVCAPWDSPLCWAVREQGGRAMSIGLHNGFDLTTRSGLKKAVALVRETRPRYMHVSPPRDPWSPLQNCNQRTEEQRYRLQERRRVHLRLLRHCRRLVEIQILELNNNERCHLVGPELEHHAGGEHPLRAQSGKLCDMRYMTHLCGGRFVVNGCRHGWKNPKTGRLLRKPWGWFSTHAKIREALELKCNHSKDMHDLIQGDLTARTAIYPELLCRRFAKALLQKDTRLFSVFGNFHDDFQNKEVVRSEKGFIGAGDEAFDDDDYEPSIAPPSQEPAEAEPQQDPTPAPNPPELGEEEVDESHLDGRDIDEKLRIIHRNLGHPCKETMLRMLRDAGVSELVLQRAQNFECAECLQRGRKHLTRPSIPGVVREKWHTISIDTFWWKFPRECLGDGEKNVYVVGLSMLDEATDYHCAILVKQGEVPQTNLSSAEFKHAFAKSWLQRLPAPTVLRYDEEGFLRRLEIKQWLETFGMKLEPIAGESAWQLGKHSKHLQTLKEQMNLLSLEVGTSFEPEEILALAVSAKNSLHNIRGYSPNQWAFGQNHNRIASFLQQHDILPLQAKRQDDDFEKQLQIETTAQKLFLEADAKRRLGRALRNRCRPVKEFLVGQLVYYFRRDRREGNKYGGTWYGPARVLCHEKTNMSEGNNHSGSVVWISHAGVLLRCSPEQIRPVTRDLQQVDVDINGHKDFSSMLQQVVQQQRFCDLLKENLEPPEVDANQDESGDRFRLRGKRPAEDLFNPPIPELDEETVEHSPRSVVRDGQRFEEHAESQRGQRGGPDISEAPKRPRRDGHQGFGTTRSDGRQEVHQPDLRGSLPGSNVPEVGGGTLPGGRSLQSRHAEIPGVRPPSFDGGSDRTSGEQRKRKPSVDLSDYEDRQRRLQDGSEGASASSQRDGRGRGESVSMEPSRRESSGEHRTRGGVTASEWGGTLPTHEQPRGHDPADIPVPEGEGELSVMNERIRSNRQCMNTTKRNTLDCGLCQSSELADFHGYVNQLDVVEMTFHIAPRDVHSEKGVWMLNQKVKKNAEVVLRKLCESERQEFDQAMSKEIQSYVMSEAVRICESKGIPINRILQMRWVYTWKTETDTEGKQTGKRAKARLIVKGFQDPRLTHLPREAPTLSNLGRNLLMSCSASDKTPLFVGDIKTAFLQGKQSEIQENVFAEPPPEVRKHLGMKDTEILRITKAIYGLLNAPKQWFESWSSYLIESGWTQHRLDQCLYKLIVDGKLCGYLGMHVDDILCTGSGEYFQRKIHELKERFKFGTWENAMESTITFCGCEIRQNQDYRIHMTQERFALGVEEIPLSVERRNETEEEISQEEKTAMRQRLGALNWRATQTAPWLLATVSLLQGCLENGKVSDVLSVNKLVRLQRKHFDKGLWFEKLNGPLTVVTFTDASWATRRDSSSQGGQITLLMEQDILSGAKTRFSVLSWTSRRLKRIARSSTSAEAQMTSNALDTHEFAKLAFVDLKTSERIDLRRTDEYLRQISSCMVCDAKNIYDGICKVETSGLHMEEKRTAIELLAIKERLQQANISLKWVNGDQELADGLTKGWKHETLVRALEDAKWRIVYDPSYQSAKKMRAQRQSQSDDSYYVLYCLWSLADSE